MRKKAVKALIGAMVIDNRCYGDPGDDYEIPKNFVINFWLGRFALKEERAKIEKHKEY